MANLKNWLPEMSAAERAWFDKCPKAVLFEIARQFGMRVGDAFTLDAGFDAMRNEWDVLHAQDFVPQKPYQPKIKQPIRHEPRRLGDNLSK